VPIGDRLVIAKAGVDTTISRATVPVSGAMPDPVGYFNAVWYDFNQFPGLGGYANAGNLVLSGHVDCARCINGGSGRAVFYSIRTLAVGDTASYHLADGRVLQYEVIKSETVSPAADWAPILSSAAADMTLITCTGTFSGGEYNLRHVVAFKKTS
jgi:LPXTG-site transpeptidase (sortase) family protein